MSDALKRLMNMETVSLGSTNALGKPRHFIFPIQPIPKGRPRAGITKTGRVFLTTPERTRQYEDWIRKATRAQFPLRQPLNNDIAVFINLYCADRKAGDIDNLAKAILDGMQTVAFGDDGQVLSLYIEMHFCNEEPCGEPRSEVIVAKRKKNAEYLAEEQSFVGNE